MNIKFPKEETGFHRSMLEHHTLSKLSPMCKEILNSKLELVFEAKKWTKFGSCLSFTNLIILLSPLIKLQIEDPLTHLTFICVHQFHVFLSWVQIEIYSKFHISTIKNDMRLKAKGEGGGRGRDGLIASPTQWTWICANSGR